MSNTVIIKKTFLPYLQFQKTFYAFIKVNYKTNIVIATIRKRFQKLVGNIQVFKQKYFNT